MKNEVTLDELHLAFDQALLTQSCQKKWPEVYKAMQAFRFATAKSLIEEFVRHGDLEEEGAQRCIEIIDGIKDSKPTAIF